MTDLGTLGGSGSTATAINDAGQVVGRASTAGVQTHAFIWQSGVMTDLGTLGGTYSTATAINASGQVVGQASTAAGEVHAFIWQSGVMTDLGTLLGGTYSTATAINTSGQVVGEALTAAGETHAFIWQSGVMTDLGTLGGTYSTATAINAAGQVVGGADNAMVETHAFIWQSGVMTDLDTSGGPYSSAAAINTSGQVAGFFYTAVWESHAFVRDSVNGMTDLNPSGGPGSSAAAINTSGQVVGYAYTAGYSKYAFIAQMAFPHTVTFDANGGSGSMSNQVASSATALTSNAFTRAGYTFAGWNTVAGGGGTAYANDASYPFIADVTLFAQWILTSSLTGSLSGSVSTSGSTPNLTTLGNTDWAVWGYASGGTSTSLTPDVRKSGGSAISALTDINACGKPLRGLGQFPVTPFRFTWTNGAPTASATNVYAGLQHYNGLLGTVGCGFSFTVPADTTMRRLRIYVTSHVGTTARLTAALSDGSALTYTDTSIPFGGNSPGVYTIDYASGTANQTLTITWVMEAALGGDTDNVAIYAVALSEDHTVTFDGNGGSGSMSPQVASSATALTSNAFTRTGYTFAGWNTLANGTGTPYTDGASYPFTADVTLYAQWTADSQTLTFNSNGGTAVTAITQDFGTSVSAPTDPTRTGYTFGGWYNEVGLTTPYTFPHTMGLSTTLYAKWTADTYTVTFNKDGGTGTTAPITGIAYNATVTLPSAPTKAGNTFGGWYTALNGGGTQFTAATPVTADITVYAKWTADVALTPIFVDVPYVHWANNYIERLYLAGITSGCTASPLNYCPDNEVTRAQMAVFLLKGIHGPAYTPPAATGLIFGDVPLDYWASAWIERIYTEGITAGCTTSSLNFCPDQTLTTRAQMTVFLLKARHGANYIPPAATGVFSDVPTSYWAAAWIEQLAAEGITSGCGGGNYCPESPLTRAQMAVFLVKTFNLP